MWGSAFLPDNTSEFVNGYLETQESLLRLPQVGKEGAIPSLDPSLQTIDGIFRSAIARLEEKQWRASDRAN